MSVDLSFQAIGTETMREYWPVFVAGATLEAWLVKRRLRRSRRYPVARVVIAAFAAASLAASLWGESFLATQLVYQTVGEGAHVDVWQDLQEHYWRSRPLLVALSVVGLGLAAHPRSELVIAALVAAAGVLVSWMAAMWLFVTSHHDIVARVLVLPGGLGAVASLVGFIAATALWMSIGRWIWRRPSRSRGITSHANARLPELRR